MKTENSAHGFTEGSETSGSVAATKEEPKEKEEGVGKHTPTPWRIRFFRDGEPEQGFFIEGPKVDPKAPYNRDILSEDASFYPWEDRLKDAEFIVEAVNNYNRGMTAALHHSQGRAIALNKEVDTLRDQIRQRDELIKEMVATLKTVNGLVDAHQLNQYIPQGNLDSLIKKSQKL